MMRYAAVLVILAASTAAAQNGACCSTMGCTDTDSASCGGADIFQGAGTSCADSPNPCACTIGSCPAGEECLRGSCVIAEHTDRTYVEEEQGSITLVAGKAEEFSSRCFHSGGKRFTLVDAANAGSSSADTDLLNNACDARWMEAQEDPFTNSDSFSVPTSTNAPFLDYKFTVAAAGTYYGHFRSRSGRRPANDDSFFVEIVELRESITSNSDLQWYRIAPSRSLVWQSNGGKNLNSAGGGNTRMSWDIPAAGTYTLRISERENATPVDAFALVREDASYSPSGCLESTLLADAGLGENGECAVESFSCTTNDISVGGTSRCATIQFID